MVDVSLTREILGYLLSNHLPYVPTPVGLSDLSRRDKYCSVVLSTDPRLEGVGTFVSEEDFWKSLLPTSGITSPNYLDRITHFLFFQEPFSHRGTVVDTSYLQLNVHLDENDHDDFESFNPFCDPSRIFFSTPYRYPIYSGQGFLGKGRVTSNPFESCWVFTSSLVSGRSR